MICPNCDRNIEEDAVVCEYCGKTLSEPEEEEVLEQEPVAEPRPLMGFLGATVGAALSCVLIVLLQKVGLVPSFGGLAVPFFIFIGYSLLCKGKTKSGLGVCIMFTVLTPYVAHQMNGAIWLMANVKEISGIPLSELSFYENFLLVPTAIAEDAINVVEYFMELFKLYIFAAAGAVAYVAGVSRARKKKKMQEKKNQ